MSATRPLEHRPQAKAREDLERRAKRSFSDEEWQGIRERLLTLFRILQRWNEADRQPHER